MTNAKIRLQAFAMHLPFERVVGGRFTSISPSGPIHHSIFGKFEAEHVTQFLDHAHKHDIDDSPFRSTGRWFRLAYVLIGVAIFVFLTLFLLPDQSTLYFEVLKGIGIFSARSGFRSVRRMTTRQNRRWLPAPECSATRTLASRVPPAIIRTPRCRG